jgi:hypothetical protein
MNKIAHKIAFYSFSLFLVWIFINAYFTVEQEDLLVYSKNILFATEGSMTHALPLGNLIYQIIPLQVFVWLSPLALVLVYLQLYFLVSKKIIYWYPITILIPFYWSALSPSMIDWLLIPHVYKSLVDGKERKAIALGVLMIFMHGPFALGYLFVILTFLRRH